MRGEPDATEIILFYSSDRDLILNGTVVTFFDGCNCAVSGRVMGCFRRLNFKVESFNRVSIVHRMAVKQMEANCVRYLQMVFCKSCCL